MLDDQQCFVAFARCGHMVFASVDRPESRKDNAKAVARLIRAGYRVEKRASAEVRSANWCPDECDRRSPQQGPRAVARRDEDEDEIPANVPASDIGTCPVCRERFVKTRQGHVYCSPACRLKEPDKGVKSA